MARSIWTGSISFGLVNVPVKLYGAVTQHEIRFHMLHDADGGRIRMERRCSIDGEEIPYEHVVKGYELAPHRYVTVTREELEKLDPRATRTVEILDFVDLDEIDPIYYETTYYLAPDRGASKPYRLLLEAMKETRKVAISRVVLRTRQYLCAVRPVGEVLALSTLLYADEVRDRGEIEEEVAAAKPTERELQMAVQLVQSLATGFDPSKYRDEYEDEVKALLDKKAAGEAVVAPEEEERPAKVVSLVDALERSLAAAGKRPERGERRAAGHAAARTSKKRARGKRSA